MITDSFTTQNPHKPNQHGSELPDSNRTDSNLPESHRSDVELAVLSAIGKLLTTQSDRPQLLRAVLSVLEQKLAMSRTTVVLLSMDGKEMFVEAGQGERVGSIQDSRYLGGDGIIGSVVQSGQTAIIPHLSQEPRFCNLIHCRQSSESREVSYLCVPIVMGKKIMGAISADVPRCDMDVLHTQARVLEIVAGMIALELKSRRPIAHQPSSSEGESKPRSLKHRVDILEMEMIVDALQAANGNMTAAALQLGITPRMARYKIKKLGIDYQSFCKTRQ